MKSFLKSMTVRDFCALPDHPKQRPTERHAKKAIARYLGSAHEAHRWVVSATLNGVRCKVDGHTRAFLWQSKELAPPAGGLQVTEFACTNAEELNALYDTFDNPVAAEDSKDRLGGALKFFGIENTSPGVSDSLTTALSIVTNGKPVLESCGLWETEIRLAMQIQNGSIGLGGAMTAAVLASLRRHGATVLPLWNAYRMNQGSVENEYSCPVKELIAKRQEPRFNSGSSNARRKSAEYALGTVERWIRTPHKMTKNKATGLVMTEYLKGRNTLVPVEQQTSKGNKKKIDV